MIHDDGREEEISSFPKLDVVFKGKYGTVKIHKSIVIQRSLKFYIGTGGYVILEKGVNSESAVFDLSSENSLCFIGKNSTIRNLRCFAGGGCKNIDIIIGDDCMFSLDVIFRPSDIHAIFDMNNPSLPINIPQHGIKIGNHVWLGHDVFVTRDVIIPDNCVIGARSTLTRRNFEANSIIAGSPAKLIKNNISWDRLSIEKFLSKNNIKYPTLY